MILFNRIVLCFLALLMFSTSACFAIDTHYCGDEIQSISLFSKAETCEVMSKRLKEENKELPPCCKKLEKEKEQFSKSNTSFKKKPCCYNKSQSFQKDVSEDGEASTLILSNGNIEIPQGCEIVHSLSFEKQIDSLAIPPPYLNLTRDILTLHQVFII